MALACAVCLATGSVLAEENPPQRSDLAALLGEPVLRAGDESGADRLRSSLELYLTAAAFENGIVSIEPVDEGYRITARLSELGEEIAGLEDISLRMDDYAILVSEQPDGRWFVASSGPFAMSLSFRSPSGEPGGAQIVQRLDYEVGSHEWAGYWDPEVQSFTRAEGYLGTVRQVETNPAGTTTTTSEPIRTRFTGEVGEDGGLNMEAVQSGGAFRQEGTVSLDPRDPESAISFVVQSGDLETVVNGEGMRTAEVMRLYGVGIELLTRPEPGDLLEELKDALRAALPVWTRFASDMKIGGITVDVGPFGSGRIGSADVDMALDGISTTGTYSIRYGLTDIAITSPFVPEWASALIPDRVVFEAEATDVDLLEPATLLISDLRLNAEAPVSRQTLTKVDDLFQASGASFGIVDSSIAGRGYRIDYSADFADGDVSVDVRAEGIDTLIAGLQEAGRDYPQALQGVSVLQMAKGFGRPVGDGALEWAATFGRDQSITVNGAMLRAPESPQPPSLDPGAGQFEPGAPSEADGPTDPL
ncbi:hypothetical protein [Fulvimarina endophytica]|uniref:hypothetical protein n=1 Tax=Fulvimarina endophytica TaxID=2293836 RepID=UPI0013143D84|nr:hypothetical protein [Fulvimarina endophytica]